MVRPAWSEGRSSSTSGGSGHAWASALRFFFHLYNLYNCLCIQKRKDEEEKKGGVSDGGEPMKGSLPVANLL